MTDKIFFAVVIPPEGEVTTVDLPIDDQGRFRFLQQVVGGCVQKIPLPGVRYMVMNENAKLAPHMFNQTATAFALEAGSIIAGTVAIIPQKAMQ